MENSEAHAVNFAVNSEKVANVIQKSNILFNKNSDYELCFRKLKRS